MLNARERALPWRESCHQRKKDTVTRPKSKTEEGKLHEQHSRCNVGLGRSLAQQYLCALIWHGERLPAELPARLLIFEAEIVVRNQVNQHHLHDQGSVKTPGTIDATRQHGYRQDVARGFHIQGHPYHANDP
jgi:hypothetical protein